MNNKKILKQGAPQEDEEEERKDKEWWKLLHVVFRQSTVTLKNTGLVIL